MNSLYKFDFITQFNNALFRTSLDADFDCSRVRFHMLGGPEILIGFSAFAYITQPFSFVFFFFGYLSANHF